MNRKFVKVLALGMAAATLCSLAACGGSSDAGAGTVQIAVINKGYGTEWLSKIVDEYKTTTGKSVKLLPPSSNNSKYRTELLAGPNANKTDLYFNIDAKYFVDVISNGPNAVKGYDCAFADLSDVYEEVLPDYGASLKDMMPEYYLDAMTYEGKQYTLPWAQGVEGVVYNAELFAQYELKVPNTTDEMIALFQKIKTLNNGSYATTTIMGEEHNIYPVLYARENNYSMYAWMTWWSQYEGMDGFNRFLKGVDENGNYTYTIFAQQGRIEALEVANEVLKQDNGYTNPESLSFTTAQTYFLDGLGFINFNGDWLEREAKANADITGFEFMKTPVISSIVEKLSDTSMTDATLSAIIAEIDGGATSSDKCSQADFDKIKAARGLVCTEGDAHIAYIPSYSDNVEGAKDFLRFYLSKQAQDLQMKYSYGNVAPFRRDVTTLPSYAGLSEFAKSKFEIWNSSEFTGRKYNTPMTYKGGLEVFKSSRWPEMIFGSDQKSTYQTAEEYVLTDIEYYKNEWASMTRNAGVN